MGAGFFRRFPYFPGLNVITQIEGTTVIDLPVPGSFTGVDTGVVCAVGEFADMTYAVSVDGSGNVTTKCRPVVVTSAQDMLNKVGGFDPTIGEFGGTDGNGFCALRNKSFSELIIAPVNLASAAGMRFYRQLPLCLTTTNPQPVVPVSPAVLAAGTQFRQAGGGVVNVGAAVDFTALPVIAAGIGGATTNASGAATQDFTVSTANFPAIVRPDGQIGILAGDIVVIGNNNAGALQPLPAGGNLGAGTYRVQTAAVSGSPTVLVLEALDGSNFAFVTASTIPWRIHVGSDADSAPVVIVGSTVDGGYNNAGAGGYSIPARPLTDETGGQSATAWTAGNTVLPIVAQPAITGNQASPLSGLEGQIHPSVAFVYTATVQKQNAGQSSALDALYTAAIAATISSNAPLFDIDIIFSARTSLIIRNQLKQNVLNASLISHGRMACIRPELNQVFNSTTAVEPGDPGVGANRDERVIYNWPAVQTYIPEAVGYNFRRADGSVVNNGILDVGFDGYMVSLLSNLPAQLNPGQAAQPVPQILASILGLQSGLTAELQIGDYILLKANGVAAPRIDSSVGPILQSGITTSLTSGQTDINRRRFADFCEDSLAVIADQYSKLPLTTANQDAIVGEITNFGEELCNPENPVDQVANSYLVDDVSGNSEESLAANIFVIIFKCKMTPIGNYIVVQAEVGNNVSTTSSLTANG